MPSSSPEQHRDTTAGAILREIREQKPGAWDKFRDFFEPLIYSYCRKKGLRLQDAEVVIQESLKTACKSLPSFKQQSLSEWINQIVKSRLSEQLHRQQHTSLLPLVLDQAKIETDSKLSDPVWDNLLVQQIAKRLQSEVPENVWQLYWDVECERKSPEELAASAAMTREAVLQSNYRVRNRLRLEIEALQNPLQE